MVLKSPDESPKPGFPLPPVAPLVSPTRQGARAKTKGMEDALPELLSSGAIKDTKQYPLQVEITGLSMTAEADGKSYPTVTLKAGDGEAKCVLNNKTTSKPAFDEMLRRIKADGKALLMVRWDFNVRDGAVVGSVTKLSLFPESASEIEGHIPEEIIDSKHVGSGNFSVKTPVTNIDSDAIGIKSPRWWGYWQTLKAVPKKVQDGEEESPIFYVMAVGKSLYDRGGSHKDSGLYIAITGELKYPHHEGGYSPPGD